MLFRQLFEPVSSTYTYLLGCEDSGEALLIDPVIETIARDLSLIAELNLRLACTVETHVHADHVTSAWELRRCTGCRTAYPAAEAVACADLQLSEAAPLQVGSLRLQPLRTPGHTVGGLCLLLADATPAMLFTGDALLIDGCGRTDLQGGNAGALYDGLWSKILTLPDETLVYPGHDYQQRRVSSIGQERSRNPRLGSGKTRDEFIAIMSNLNLPYPNKLETAIPANRCCGDVSACTHVRTGR